MKNMKYFSTWLCVGVLLTAAILLPVSQASAQQSQQSVVDRMLENDYTIFWDLESFGWERASTRWEISKFMLRFAESQEKGKVRSTEECQFDDLDGYDYTLVPTIIAACEYGIVKGFEGNYMPNNLVTEAEIITMMVRILVGEHDETVSPWWYRYHEVAVWTSIYGQGTEKNVRDLDTPALRGTVATWLYRGDVVDTERLNIEGTLELQNILEEAFGKNFWQR